MSWRAWAEAAVGSMRASTRRVMVKSLRAGRKFLTPEMRFSSPTPPMPPSRSRSVNWGEVKEKGSVEEV